MAIEDLMNHKARVWRPVDTRGEYAEVVNGWELVTDPSVNNCEPPPMGLVIADQGGGEASSGEVRRWYMTRGSNLAERDVIEVFAGPQATSYWRVLGVSYPRAHHYRFVAEPYVGDPPEES